MRTVSFIDSNLWLYAYLRDQDPGKRQSLERTMAARPCRWVISTQVVAEVGCNLLKKGHLPEADLRSILTLLQRACDCVPVTVETGLEASRLRETLAVSYWDSLIIASALESGCNELWSEDLQHGQIIDKRLRIVNPLVG